MGRHRTGEIDDRLKIGMRILAALANGEEMRKTRKAGQKPW
jgi:hypothetical protein